MTVQPGERVKASDEVTSLMTPPNSRQEQTARSLRSLAAAQRPKPLGGPVSSRSVQSVCVFCGSSPGADSLYTVAVRRLAETLVQTGRTLVYGGARVGLMGVLADSVLAAGGRAIGVMPQALVDKEIAHKTLTELHIVSSMHERKSLMADMADAFVAMPGGIGTLEEFLEVWTWGQLGLHQKPLGMLGTMEFFGPLLAYLDVLVTQRFLRAEHRDMVAVDDDPTALLERLERYVAPEVAKWIDRVDS